MENHIPVLPESADIIKARSHWQFTGSVRPDFALHTTAEQESVWDYPRPPEARRSTASLKVYAGDDLVAQTGRGIRVLETSGAPTYYFPPDDVDLQFFEFGELTSVCEWKGVAQTINVAGRANAAWRYVQMFPAFTNLYQWVSFYPAKLACYVDDEKVEPQPGGFYGGWVTKNIIGPIKGDAGSEHW
jgi:uncharacterized protein (DUF427 family)